jgi:hypothetical protein
MRVVLELHLIYEWTTFMQEYCIVYYLSLIIIILQIYFYVVCIVYIYVYVFCFVSSTGSFGLRVWVKGVYEYWPAGSL